MSEKKSQLHQLLAVENDRKKQADNIIAETVNTFVKKADHFDGVLKVYTPKDENGTQIPAESKEIVTSVKEKLNYSQHAITKGIDAQISKEETNASGTVKAELSIGNLALGELSATSLLALEQYVVKIRNTYKSIPTLDPTKKWTPDKDAGDNIYAATPEVKYRTEKTVEVIEKAKATDKHPAQTELVQIDKQVGEYRTTYRSGKVTPKQKSDLLCRIDALIDAIKQARSNANEAEIVNKKIGNKIFKYIDSGIL